MNVGPMIDTILRHEGGYVDHPNDRGGPTNFGITLATLRKERDDPSLTADDVKAMTKDEAKTIYRRSYYLRPGVDRLTPAVQPFVFDCAVNHGPRRAVRFVQSVCNQSGQLLKDIAVDGIMGPATAQAAAAVAIIMDDYFLAALVEERANFFRRIVEADDSQRVFLNGWLRRAYSFWPDTVERLAA